MKEHNKEDNKDNSPDDVQKQMINDLEQLLKKDLGSLLALNEEGSEKQIEAARQKVRSDLLKYAPEMKKMAEKMGGQFAGAVDEFLKSVDGVLGSMGQWLDQSKVNEHFKATNKLDHQLGKDHPKPHDKHPGKKV
ncbi:MAG TPA: hypothetical protein VLG76_00295 [Rhabdochlamydiaceae bacterium]|nr:hypothetical protein [Rhabdochlamydiaceae bacterium]